MKTLFRTAGLMASAALVMTAAGSAIAADPPKTETKVERQMDGQRGGRGEGRWARHNPEMRAQHLRDVLQLRPDQEPALKAFLDASAPGMKKHRMGPPPGEAGKGAPPERKMMTTPQRLDMQAMMMAERQKAFEKRAAATKTFYAALSPSQQKAFDALHGGKMGRGMGGPHMKKMRMGGHGRGPHQDRGHGDND
jgi:periplasmic protein CpxP/Spy